MSDNSTDVIVTAADLRQSIVLYTSTFLALILLYAALRNSKYFFERVFYPLYPHIGLSEYEKELRTSEYKPPQSWIPDLYFKQGEKDVLEHVSLDAYVTLRLTKLPLRLFTFWSLYAVLFLVPLYAVSGDSRDIFVLISISSVENDQVGLFIWLYCSMIVFMVCIVLLMDREYRKFIQVKRDYLVKKSRERYTIVVERVPAALMPKRSLRKYFEAIMGSGTVFSITYIPKPKVIESLTKLIAKRKKLLVDLEIYLKKLDQTEKPETLFVWETDTNAVIEKLVDFKIEEEGIDENKPDELITERIESIIAFDSYEELNKMIESELNGYMNGKKLRSLLNKLTCGILKQRYIDSGAARMVEKEEFLRSKLKILNRLIDLLQQRLSIFMHTVDNPKFYEEVRPQPTFEELKKLLFREENEEEDKQEQTFVQKFKTSVLETLNMDKPKSEEEKIKAVVHEHIQFAAFVTFNNRCAANVAAKFSVDDMRDMLRTTPAQRPDDMKLENVNYSVFYKTAIGFISFFGTVLFLFSFGSFVGFLGFATNLESLQRDNDEVNRFVEDNSFIVDISQQLSPYLLTIAFFTVGPVLSFLYGLQKPVSGLTLNRQFFFGYYVFGVIQLFIFFQASSSFVSSVGDIIEDPVTIIETLSETIPNNAVFFMQFVLIRALFLLPIELLRIYDLLTGIILRTVCSCRCNETQREKNITKLGCLIHPQKPQNPFLAKLNALTMLVYTIGITYSLISPLITIACLLYSILFTYVMRNQFLYVYATKLKKTDSLGSQFEQYMSTFLVALFILVLTMMGIFSLNGVFQLTIASVPLLIVIILVKIYFSNLYSKELSALPLALAKFYDVSDLEDNSSAPEEVEADAENLDLNNENEPLLKAKYYDFRHKSLKAPPSENLGNTVSLHLVGENVL